MNIDGVSPQLQETLGVFDGERAGAPLTTSEVAAELSVSRRSTYERLTRLADREFLQTKKVGAKARIWWRDSPAETELKQRVRQQEAVTELGQVALEDRDIESLLRMASERVAETLDNDYCKVLDLDEDGAELLLRAGVGWDEGIVGAAAVSATDDDSQAAYTLATDEPVVVEDLQTESRFSGPDLLNSHHVRSGISVIIGTAAEPWGILGTHDTERKSFSEHDVNFVQSVANILASAITRHADEERLVAQRNQLAALANLQEVVRVTTDAVINQSTRSEIESVVCEHLAATDSYEFAWIGGVDHRSQSVHVRAEAGVENYLDDITISVDPDNEHSVGPTGRAFLTGETQTCQQIQTDRTVVDQLEYWDDIEIHDWGTDNVASFEARLVEPPILTALANAGGRLVEAGIDDGSYHMTLQLPPGADVRSVIETVKTVYTSAEMLTRRQTTRESFQTSAGVFELEKRLTDRQSAVLRAAYHAGFFEWPRAASGEDVASSLDITPPTFHQHLRKAEKQVFDSIVPALL